MDGDRELWRAVARIIADFLNQQPELMDRVVGIKVTDHDVSVDWRSY